MAGTRQFDEDALLDAVLDVFWRKGWQATAMADLADAAGVQRGSLYHAYGGKETLFLRAFDRYADRFLAQTRRALVAPGDADPRQTLRRFLHVAIRHMTAGEPPRGCLTTKTAAEVSIAGETIRVRLARLLQDLRTALTETLSAPPIVTRLALPPAQAADLLLTFTRGLAVMERIERSPRRLRAIADALARLLMPEQRG